jgi:phosphatidate cytidylyltransferase
MTRVLSALVLLPLIVGTVWFLPPAATLALAALAAVLAFGEYVAIARALGAHVPYAVPGTAVLAACGASGGAYLPLDTVLAAALIVTGATAVASGRPGQSVLRDAAAGLLPVIYIGVPLGMLAAVRTIGGREALLLLMITIVVSDSAQYYTGRAFGRRPLAPSISPKKTREGALGGVLFGILAMTLGGLRVFPATPTLLLVLLAAAVVGLGIVGDLFESLLKRSADVKDSSALIPGHGGVLDRIDSWLFAAPVYYTFVLYMQTPHI